MNATTQAQELANKLITAGVALSNGDTNTIKTIDTLRDIINDEQYLPEAPTEPGYYIPRDGTTFILCLDGDGDWSAKELDLNKYGRFTEVRDEDGTCYHPWSFIVRLLPASAFPLIRIASVTDLKFTYKPKEENDND